MNKHLKKATMAVAAGALVMAAASTAARAGGHRSAEEIQFKPANVQQVKPGPRQPVDVTYRHQPRYRKAGQADTQRVAVRNQIAFAAPMPQGILALGGTVAGGGWACQVMDGLGLEQFGVEIALRCD
jgi:hypothetical protein